MSLFNSLLKKIRPYASFKQGSSFYTCNICGWQGAHFVDDAWHKYSRCPNCWSSVRHRLLLASFEYSRELNLPLSLSGKRILHFAPERILSNTLDAIAYQYVTADFLRQDCDLKLDMCNMSSVDNDSYDVVIALDVLEHVPDFKQALKELYRCLNPDGGFAVLTVPQVERLSDTFEDSTLTSAEQRREFYGQWDHLRLFGEDFKENVAQLGFAVSEVSGLHSTILFLLVYAFSSNPSPDKNATNNRRIYFAIKNI